MKAPTGEVLLLFLNGMVQGSNDVEFGMTDDPYRSMWNNKVKFINGLRREDQLKLVVVAEDPITIEWEVPYTYPAGEWVELGNFHDPNPEKPVTIEEAPW